MKKLLLTITLLSCIRSVNALSPKQQWQQYQAIMHDPQYRKNPAGLIQALQNLYTQTVTPQQTALQNALQTQITTLQTQMNALNTVIQNQILQQIQYRQQQMQHKRPPEGF